MLRRPFFRSLLAGAVALPGLAATHAKGKPKIPGKFVHTVLFWLKDDVDPEAFISATEAFLQKVKEVRAYHLGQPAMTPREVVDNSYSVCLVVTFDSKEDQDIYQEHPAHVAYVASLNNQWTRVQIYDSWAG